MNSVRGDTLPAIVVVGAGISGLTCAHALRQRGYRVRVIARELSPETTSDVAAAIWCPYLATPPEDVLRWSLHSYREYARQVLLNAPVSMVPMVLLHRDEEPSPWWAQSPVKAERVDAAHVPRGFAMGWRVRVPFIDTPRYMEFLSTQLLESGVAIERRTVDRLETLFAHSNVVIHCAGLGAARLANDAEVIPVRGQVVLVSAPSLKCPLGGRLGRTPANVRPLAWRRMCAGRYIGSP